MTRDKAQAILRKHCPFEPIYPDTSSYREWVIDALMEAVGREREECAKACEDFGKSYDNEWNRNLGVASDLEDVCEECAAAIRARSTPQELDPYSTEG